MTPRSGPLFQEPVVPAGFAYCSDFITTAEEAALLEDISRISFSTFEMRGVVARRRVAYFGESYDQTQAAPFPGFLLRLRDRIGTWSDHDPHAFVMALINEYPPGAPIGWHRDAPRYDVVVGISLLSACRMRFRPYRSPAASRPPHRHQATHEIRLDQRSAYLMTGESRSSYEHQIPPVTQLRYSITFRTLRPITRGSRSGP
jgi:alkylated DNA repair dioxygenase AlkB